MSIREIVVMISILATLWASTYSPCLANGGYPAHLDNLSSEAILDSVQKIKFTDKETTLQLLFYLEKRTESEKNDEARYKVFMNLGTQYAYSADYFNALLYYDEALKICESKNQESPWNAYKLKTKINLSGIHWALKNNEKFEKANWENLKLARELKDTQILGAIHQSLALYHNQILQLDSAEFYFKKSIEYYSKNDDFRKLNSVYVSYSKNLLSQAKYKEAKELLEKNTAFLNSFLSSEFEHFHSTELVKVYYFLGEIDKAYQLACASKNKVLYEFPSKMEILEIISDIHASREKFDSAYIYLKEARNIANNYKKNDLVVKTKELEAQLLFQKNEQEKKYLLEQNAQSKRMNFVWTIISIVLFGLILIIINLYTSLLTKKQELDTSAKKTESLNKRLLHLIEDKKNLIGLIAHDLRAPLSHIQLNYYLLLKKVDSSQKDIEEYTQDIANASQLINEALVKLIDIESKSIDSEYFTYMTIDAAAFTEIVVKEQSPIAKLKGIELRLEERNSLNFISVDPFFFKHIITNILQNALKHSPPNGTVLIQIFKSHKMVNIAISDDGSGMDQTMLDSMYSNASSDFNVPPDNTTSWGRGLFLSMRIAKEMDGSIQLRETNTQGATFEVSFPAVEEE
jgi:signal transduction histidine kinase